MRVTARREILTITSDQGITYAFDASGRLYAVHNNGWFVQRGIDGRMVARQWQNGMKRVHDVSGGESERFLRHAQMFAGSVLSSPGTSAVLKIEDGLEHGDVMAWIQSAYEFDYGEDNTCCSRMYRTTVGILPPDHYLPVVFQFTEGCEWNQCTFCSFYKKEHFRRKSRGELFEHIDGVKGFIGKGINLRNSVFLSEANCLCYDPTVLTDAVCYIREQIAPSMPRFRGISTFMEPSSAGHYSSGSDFNELFRAGLTYIYIGLETGSDELRNAMKKKDTASTVLRIIRAVKEGGIPVGIIVLIGFGDERIQSLHVRETLKVIHDLELDSSDMVFLSPLVNADVPDRSSPLHPVTYEAVSAQYHAIREGLPTGVRSALYEIQGFLY